MMLSLYLLHIIKILISSSRDRPLQGDPWKNPRTRGLHPILGALIFQGKGDRQEKKHLQMIRLNYACF